MKRYAVTAIITAGLIGLSNLSCKPSKPSDTFYLRSCRTGKLIGPVVLKPGHLLPSLDEQKYIVADPTDSELEVRKCLLETLLYESHYIDCTLAEVVETINQMLKHRLSDKAPPVRIESVDTTQPPFITMDINEEPAYDALCNISAQAQVRIFVEQGVVVLSRREFGEMPDKSMDSYVQ